MYYQVEQVLEKYEPEVENYYKGRGILVCEAKQGLFALKEFFGSEEKAEFLYWVGVCLETQGLRCDGMIRTKTGEYISTGVDGIPYTMHRWIKGRECDVRSRSDIMSAVACIAKFHEACGGLEADPAGFGEGNGRLRGMNFCEEYVRHDRELKKVKGYIEKRRNKSGFERLYLSCFADFYRQSQDVVGYLKREAEPDGGYSVGICHGDLNQHNILFAAREPAIVHLEHAYVGIQMADLGNFMRKILEKYDWEERLGMDMLKEYRRVRPLGAADLRGLYCRLSYPEKFWKIANHYYNSRKVCDSGKNEEKLCREIRQNVSRARFLERFGKLL